MPSINKEFLSKLQNDTTNYTCFIETGTYKGETIFELENYFEKLYTIEISNKFYNETKAKYNGNKIQFILGDSSYVFNDLLPIINDNTIFFLDGHWSCDDTGKGEKDCPLIEEIQIINNLFKNKAIVIIDDVRLFGLSPKKNYPVDWEDINVLKILEILKSRIISFYFLDSSCAPKDRLIIHINSQNNI